MGLINLQGPIVMSWCATLEREPNDILSGDVGLVCQSGALLGSIWDMAMGHGLGYSALLSTGNEADLEASDFVEYFALDEKTRVITAFIEGLRNPQRFLEAVELAYKQQKPVIVYKIGRTEEASRAAASHTASLAGNEQVYDSAIKQVGAIRLDSWLEYWEVPRIFAYQQLPSGNRVAILTLTGGVAVVGVDVAVSAGLSLARFSPATADKLKRIYPRLSSNPVDLGPILSVADNPFAVEEEVIALALNDVNVDCAAIAVYAGFDDIVAPIVEMFDHLKERITNRWLSGFMG
jgi:acyl-CoA synthetase (NDP forming)